jgi:hypothetical protein
VIGGRRHHRRGGRAGTSLCEFEEFTMVVRIAAWEAKDGTVHKTREEAGRHDFEQFAIPRLRKFLDAYFAPSAGAPSERRWSAEEIYQALAANAEELAGCFPPRTTVLTEALAVPSVQRRAREPNGHEDANGLHRDLELSH